MVKLGDVCDILNGFAFKSEQYVEEGIRIIRIANVQKGFIEDSTPVFYPIDSKDAKKYSLEEGDMLMSLTGNVGRVAKLSKEFLPAALNQRVACLRIKDGIALDKAFLFNLLNSDYFEQQCIAASKGVAQKNMSTEWLKEYEIPMFPPEQQHAIASVLDKVSELIALRKEQLAKLDQLVKSRFFELFGDTPDDEKKTMAEICKIITDGTHQPPKFTLTGIPFLFVSNIVTNEIHYGQRIGKTIIFAKNHRHAEKIYEVFNKEYPHLPGFAKVIDNTINYSQSLIDDFSDPKKLPQIAISVDMLDTGIDVPECLNLVFFKKVMSKAKFWQMIGRGTRLCPGLRDGEDKDKFYIFDFCNNFEFFRMGGKSQSSIQIPLQGVIFYLKAQIVFKLQDLAYQTPELIAFRKTLVDDMVRKVQELNKENFAVHQHLKYVELFSNPDNYLSLTYENTLQMREELAPLIIPDGDEASAVRFDALMYGIELAYLVGKKYKKARTDLLKKVGGIASVANIPDILLQKPLLERILNTDYLETAGINEFEHIRESLRDLMKYLPHKVRYVDSILRDEILTMDWNESELENDDLKNYKMKAEFYVRQHQDNEVIAKLKTNQPLTGSDVKVLEEILWSELGTKQDYENEYGNKPLGEFVREIVGLDMNAAKEAFAEYLDEASLDSNQIYFVNQIVEYIVHNGLMKDLSVLQDAPFTDNGSIVEVFSDITLWFGIKKIIDRINANAIAA